MPLTIVCLFGFTALVWTVHAVTDRGLSGSAGECRWDALRRQYATDVSLTNMTTAAQDTTWLVQFRLQPKPGAQWPDRSARTRYEAASTPLHALLAPGTHGEQIEASAAIPVEDFTCTARVTLGAHHAQTD